MTQTPMLWKSSDNALWVYPNLITASKNFAPLPKKQILSERNIWKLLSLLIDIWDKCKRSNSSQGVKRNFNMLVEGCISNIWDELIVVITVNDLGIGLV